MYIYIYMTIYIYICIYVNIQTYLTLYTASQLYNSHTPASATRDGHVQCLTCARVPWNSRQDVCASKNKSSVDLSLRRSKYPPVNQTWRAGYVP